MEWTDFWIALGVAVAAFALWLIGTALWIWAERRIISLMQSRVGPNRLGPFGILQSLADGAKMFFKEDIAPRNVDRITYFAAPFLSAVVALMMFAVIPFGGTVEIAGREVRLQVWDTEIGLLWVLAMSSLGVYGLVLAGWSSGSKYPLLGGVRSSAQLISYELGLGLSLAAVFLYAGSLRVSDIVANQAAPLFEVGILGTTLSVPAWHVVPMLPAFLIFFLAATAETSRPPFDLPEAEGELVAGFHTEYSGAKFAMFQLAEFMNTVTFSAVIVTMFFGGPGGPLGGPEWLQAILPTVYFIVKVFIFMTIFTWLRATLPRVRYDRLMDLGWKVMLPVALVWVMLTSMVIVGRQSDNPRDVLRVAGIALGVALVLYVLTPLFGRRTAPPGGGGGGGAEAQHGPPAPGSGHAEPLPEDEPTDELDTPSERAGV